MRRARVVMAALAALSPACGDDLPAAPDAAGAAHAGRLGLNDATVLVPLPVDPDAPVLLGMVDGPGGAPRVPAALFARLVTAPGDVAADLARFHVVAVRFDLCDRAAPGPCPPPGLPGTDGDGDGRLRLVLQPVLAPGLADDVALHAFYPLPAAELPAVVAELRALAALAGTPRGAPLGVSPPLAAGRADYRDRLRALVAAYARPERLRRLTLFAQRAATRAPAWVFRGLEVDGAGAVDLAIPGIDGPLQRVLLAGEDSYEVEPLADAPAGLALALSRQQFALADDAGRRAALAALAEADDPARTTSATTQCVACHAATALLGARAAQAGVALEAVEPAAGDARLGIGGGVSGSAPGALRALGWFGRSPAISRRVARDTAAVLDEVEARFP